MTHRLRYLLLLPALLCLIYAVPIFLIGSGTLSYLMWVGLSAGFLFLCWILKKERLKRIPKMIVILFTLMFVLGAAVLLLVECLILSGFRKDAPQDLDYIIVLGSQVKANGPATVYRYRLDEAGAYLAENPKTLCILTGGQGRNEPMAESEGGLAYLLEQGFPEDRFLLETVSLDTPQNITYAFALLSGAGTAPEQKSSDKEKERRGTASLKIGIVTSNFHCYRGRKLAEHAAREAGLNYEFYSLPAKVTRLYLPSNMLREFFGVMRDFLFGRM